MKKEKDERKEILYITLLINQAFIMIQFLSLLLIFFIDMPIEKK